MGESFFKSFDKREQGRRHINVLFNMYSGSFTYDQITILKKLREDEGYLSVHNYIFKNILHPAFKDMIVYLQNRYNLPQDQFEEIIGLKELTDEIRTPAKYTDREEMILLIHMIAVLLFEDSIKPVQKEMLFGLGMKLGYSKDKIVCISDLLITHLKVLDDFNELPSIEDQVIQKYLQKYISLNKND